MRRGAASHALVVHVAALLISCLTLVQGSQNPCARALLVVAHPDDETLFAGELLLARVASLPKGCRRAIWHVLCVTNGNILPRRTAFRRAMMVARSHSLAADISFDMWEHEDCNLLYCSHFPGPDAPLGHRLSALLARGSEDGHPWDYVVSHNEHGEYHHIQHTALHTLLRQSLEAWNSPIRKPQFLIFNPLPELNMSLSWGKRRMLNQYYIGFDVDVGLLVSLAKYAEHIVPMGKLPRMNALSLGYFRSAMEAQQPHFSYAWMLPVDWGSAGPFNAAKAIWGVREMFVSTQEAGGCLGETDDAVEVPWYPRICSKLGHALHNLFPTLELLQWLERCHYGGCVNNATQ